jgi:prolyl oligopeptidase
MSAGLLRSTTAATGFYVHNDGLQNQSVIYATTDLKQTGRAVLDGNELSPDGVLAVVETAVSPDGC